MKKPKEIIIKLYELGWPIDTAKIKYVQTGDDTAETYIMLEGRPNQLKCKLSSIKEYINWSPDYISICQLKPEYRDEVLKWKKFEEENKTEYEEYKRLKEKFEKQPQEPSDG